MHHAYAQSFTQAKACGGAAGRIMLNGCFCPAAFPRSVQGRQRKAGLLTRRPDANAFPAMPSGFVVRSR